MPVDHVACARGCRRQHAYASARFSVERQLGHEIARQKARKSGLPVPTSPNLSYDGRARGESEVAAIRAELDARPVRADTNEFVKTKSDAFADPRLDAQLAATQAGELFIAGIDAGFCD